MWFIVILMIASIFGIAYFYKVKDSTTAMLYGIYAMLVILIYVFVVKVL